MTKGLRGLAIFGESANSHSAEPENFIQVLMLRPVSPVPQVSHLVKLRGKHGSALLSAFFSKELNVIQLGSQKQIISDQFPTEQVTVIRGQCQISPILKCRTK